MRVGFREIISGLLVVEVEQAPLWSSMERGWAAMQTESGWLH